VNKVLANLDAGCCFFAVSSVMELTSFYGGMVEPQQIFAIGAMRAIAQMISYECR
jgi:NADH:ubiquinone oxidoreductase subunit H